MRDICHPHDHFSPPVNWMNNLKGLVDFSGDVLLNSLDIYVLEVADIKLGPCE